MGSCARSLGALAQGVAYTFQLPEESFALFTKVFPELSDELNRRSFAATLPLYALGLRHHDHQRWETMQAFLLSAGLISRTEPLTELYTPIALP